MWKLTGCPGSRREETNLVQKDLRESIFGGQAPGRPQSSGCTHQATQPEVTKSSPLRTTSSSTLLSGKRVGRLVFSLLCQVLRLSFFFVGVFFPPPPSVGFVSGDLSKFGGR